MTGSFCLKTLLSGGAADVHVDDVKLRFITDISLVEGGGLCSLLSPRRWQCLRALAEHLACH